MPTPCIVIDGLVTRRNLDRMAAYVKSHNLKLRPHTKTHKSIRIARMQADRGAVGLTVAKVGEALLMSQAHDDILMAYPPVHPMRCAVLTKLAASKTIRVGIDSREAADSLAEAAQSAGSTIGILVDLDVGHHRTGVQSPTAALELAQYAAKVKGLRLDGMMFFPGHLSHGSSDAAMHGIDAIIKETLALWKRSGLAAPIVSGGSTPTADESHHLTSLTEIRPGTYVFNDMNSVYANCATFADCAATILATVVSTAVPGQIVLDAGSKTLTSDRCGPKPESGHGFIREYPSAKIAKLSEEHAQVDVTACDRVPRVGDRVNVIPNHICPCVNLQDSVWWQEPGEDPVELPVDARGKVF